MDRDFAFNDTAFDIFLGIWADMLLPQVDIFHQDALILWKDTQNLAGFPPFGFSAADDADGIAFFNKCTSHIDDPHTQTSEFPPRPMGSRIPRDCFR